MHPFAAGQVWTYDARPGEEASRIVVCRVEKDPKLGEIVHIQVNGLRMKNKHRPDGVGDRVGHMPYSGDALRKVVRKLESTEVALPDFEEGYRQWRAAFDKSKAGVWTLPVSEAIAGMEAAMNQ